MRNILAIMNIAKSAGTIKEVDYPFGGGRNQIKEEAGKKRALNKAQLKMIAEYFDGNEFTDFYRDLWLFIHFCNGISEKGKGRSETRTARNCSGNPTGRNRNSRHCYSGSGKGLYP